jgi:hypothetical protein
MDEWYKRFNKPVLMTEFGADTLAGTLLILRLGKAIIEWFTI